MWLVPSLNLTRSLNKAKVRCNCVEIFEKNVLSTVAHFLELCGCDIYANAQPPACAQTHAKKHKMDLAQRLYFSPHGLKTQET